MLVLSRKQGQSIVIAQDIVVSVVAIDHGRVQIGVTAPSHLPIHREEIQRRIQEENCTLQNGNIREMGAGRNLVVYSELCSSSPSEINFS
jgi:carbon storage regulator